MATKKSNGKKKAVKPAKKTAAKKAAAPKRASTPGVVHWEVQARDRAKQQRFFSSLFGWKIAADDKMKYGMVGAAGKDTIGGGIGEAQDKPRVTFYVQVPDINATLAKVATLGGETVMPRTDIGMIVMAQFRDPEGNIIGVIED